MLGLKDIIKEFGLEVVTNQDEIENIIIETSNVNRPGVHLAGFFDTFDTKRIQIFGKGEMAFLKMLTSSERSALLDKFFSFRVPFVIISRDMDIFEEMADASVKYKVPILKTKEVTSELINGLIRYLTYELAPRVTIHGVSMEVYGEGILIIGESGIGKSETALELIKRGHRFIADDAVEIRKVSDKTLISLAPQITKNLMEIRGVGIIDIKEIFGLSSIEDVTRLSLVIKLEEWDLDKSYDRLPEEEFFEVLGINLPSIRIPVRPGRNLAVIIEVATMNQRQKGKGYNAAISLSEKLNEEIQGKSNKRRKTQSHME